MKVKYWLCPILIFIIFSLSSGEIKGSAKIDSLRSALNKNSGSEHISTQLDLAFQIYSNNKEEAQNLAKSALLAAQISGNRSLEMRSYYILGRINSEFENRNISQAYNDTAIMIADEIDDNWNKGEFLYRKGANQHREGMEMESLESFNEALQACRLSNNFKIMGSCYSLMGVIFRVNGLYDRSIEYIIKSKLNYEKAGFSEGNAWAAYLLGRVYADIKLPEKALEYFKEALEQYEALATGDENRNGIALCHEQIAMYYWQVGNFEEALKSIELILEIHSESGSKYGISNAYKHLGMIDYYKGNYQQAEYYLNKSLVTKKEIEDLLSLPSIYEYLGLIFIEKGLQEEGFKNLQKGLEYALANDQKRIQLDIYSKLQAAYLNIKDFKKAISCQNEQIKIQNLILAGAANTKMEQLQTIYEIDEKNSQIVELEKENELSSLRIKQHKTKQVIMIIGILLVTLFSVIIIFFFKKIQFKNQKLQEAIATKDKLFSIVSHDLRAPIGSAIGLSEIFVEEIKSQNYLTINKYASLLHQSLNDTFSLLNNLLEWSLSQLQKIEFNPKWMYLYDVLEEMKDLISSQTVKKNISIGINIENNHQVFADEDMLKTIFRNLISNAIKFSNEKGSVIISTNRKGKFIEVLVRDNGVGMEPDILNSLFGIETNTCSVGTSGEKGTGLGLILVKEFVEKHGGKIWVKSKAGEGSVFGFTLPGKQLD